MESQESEEEVIWDSEDECGTPYEEYELMMEIDSEGVPGMPGFWEC